MNAFSSTKTQRETLARQKLRKSRKMKNQGDCVEKENRRTKYLELWPVSKGESNTKNSLFLAVFDFKCRQGLGPERWLLWYSSKITVARDIPE